MIRRFELQSSMLDLELEMQFPGGPAQERAVAVVNVSDQMSCECCFSGAHRPNMEVVNGGHVWQAGEILSHFGDLNQHGPDSVRFYTKTKTVTSRWPSGVKEGAEFVIPTMK